MDIGHEGTRSSQFLPKMAKTGGCYCFVFGLTVKAAGYSPVRASTSLTFKQRKVQKVTMHRRQERETRLVNLLSKVLGFVTL